MRRHIPTLIAVFLCMGLMIACANLKEPAMNALKAAEDVVKGINKEDAVKYAPEKFAAIEKGIASAKENIAKGDFKAAIAAAKDIPAQAKEVATAIAEAKKAELAKIWESASAGLPKIFEQVQSRIDIFSKSKAKKAVAEKAKTELADAKKSWTDAQELYKSGKTTEAADAVKSVKTKTSELLKGLGMPVPAALN
ncbi:MAG: hypothetical protein LLF28_06885 [Nitrospiraceae bacterium]|nr:hypothetical protein [Nitrospiraceae bacterium]